MNFSHQKQETHPYEVIPHCQSRSKNFIITPCSPVKPLSGRDDLFYLAKSAIPSGRDSSRPARPSSLSQGVMIYFT